MMANNEEISMKEFIEQNWKMLALAALMLFSITTSTANLVKKSGGKVSIWDALKSVVLEKIPSWIAIVEKDGSGEEKKNAVINMALKEAGEMLGKDLSPEEKQLIISLASKQIELILAAPQKKNVVVVAPAKPKSRYRV